MTPEPALLTTGEAAEKLKVHPATLRRWVELDWIPAITLPSGILRFRRTDIQDILDGAVRRPWAEQTPEAAS